MPQTVTFGSGVDLINPEDYDIAELQKLLDESNNQGTSDDENDDSSNIDISVGSVSNVPAGNPYIPNDSDVFALPDTPTTMEPQFGNTCVSSSIAYVANALGKNITQERIENWYFDRYKIIITMDGVPFDKISILVNQFLETGPYIGVTGAIDAGNPFITNVEISRTVDADGNLISLDGHMIIVVGYHSNGDYIFMDPLSGTLREAPPSSFPTDFSFGGRITGAK